MNKHKMMMVSAAVVVLVGGGCGEDKGTGASAAASGPSCGETAAAYVKNLMASGGNELYAMKPTPTQITEVTAKLEASCTAGWSAATRACVLKAAPTDLGTCWEDAMERARVGQVVFDYAKAAAPATP